MLLLVMATSGVRMFLVTGLPVSAFIAWMTASWPSTAGACAIASWIVPLLSMVIWVGSASNVATFTLPDIPADFTAVAAPSAVMTLAANTPPGVWWALMSPPICWGGPGGGSG